MKRNQNFDHNHSQKVLSCHYNMDTNRVEARFEDGTTLAIDCIAVEDEYDFGEDEDADEEPAEIEIHSEDGQEDET